MKELSLLEKIYKTSPRDDSILIGPGDDMALMQFDSTNLLCGVDQLIVGRHVTIETAPELIGRKAVARSFSDVAAMGGVPTGSLMTAALPPKTDESWAMAVFQGANEHAAKWGGPIVGGDIATTEENAQPMFTVTTFGTLPTTPIKRSNAQVGDVIYVTGTIGNSIAYHHLHFTPRINEAQLLMDSVEINTMIDISDGLGQDASHLATEISQLVIDTALLPLREGATLPKALSDGEDYELLFTSGSKPPEHLATPIGYVQRRTPSEPKVITTTGEDVSNLGWSHE
ncbi:MAG: thiamine-monophosphate kinase [Planctomycetes bacterium]|nr:thiamine-monophosphate kinase [Planctomycetota bacterium]